MIAETRIPITLDKERVMYFNANSMTAFEDATGKFFLDVVASLYDVMRPMIEQVRKNQKLSKGDPGIVPISSGEILRKVSMKDLTALLWASIHEYDSKDEPHWPLTLGQVRRYITPTSIPKIFHDFLAGQTSNSPTVAEMGESPASPAPPPINGNTAALKTDPAGGERSTELPVDAFA
jgi:hypothetical protein